MQYVVGSNFTAQTENGLIRLYHKKVMGESSRASSDAPEIEAVAKNTAPNFRYLENTAPNFRLTDSQVGELRAARQHLGAGRPGPPRPPTRYTAPNSPPNSLPKGKKQAKKFSFKRLSKFFGKSLLFLASGMLGTIVGWWAVWGLALLT